jgi:carboxymethylenebutenolidase
MDQRIIDLFDEYTHRPLTRAEFISRLTQMTGGLAAALAVLPLLEVNYAHAHTVPSDTGELVTENITYPAGDIQMQGYLARPKADGKYPAVIIIHENRGLNAHIEDVTRRAALAGFVALAPNALSPLGGTPADADKARELFQQLDPIKTVQQFAAAVPYLQGLSQSTGKVGCVGFCWGGAMANSLAVTVPAVPFYGRQPAAEDVPKIKAALQLHYAEKDERVNAGIPAFEQALKQAGIVYELFMYPGAQHAFHNDTSAARYNADAAKLAWERTITFLKAKLS